MRRSTNFFVPWKKSGRLEKSWKQGRRNRKSADSRSKNARKADKVLVVEQRESQTAKRKWSSRHRRSQKMTETLANDQEMFESLKTQLQESEAKNRKREAADIQKKMLALEQSFLSYEALQNARSEEQRGQKGGRPRKTSEESFHKKRVLGLP